jgi:hypothetical protein
MKNLGILFTLMLLVSFLSVQGQTASSASAKPVPSTTKVGRSLDGKTYYLSSYDANQPLNKTGDTLMFKSGKVVSASCSKYGFKSSSYHVSNQNGKMYFTATCYSDKEGKISWNGLVDGNNISGKYLWHKEGQNDISYIFTGMQK